MCFQTAFSAGPALLALRTAEVQAQWKKRLARERQPAASVTVLTDLTGGSVAAFSPSDPLLWHFGFWQQQPHRHSFAAAIAVVSATRSFLLHLVTLHCSLAWTRLPFALLSTAHAVLFRFMRSA